jgi:2'-5' RNA ligase
MTGQAMIAYLPTNTRWCKQELAHMTLVYAGETEGRSESDFNALAKDMVSVARVTGPFTLQVTGVEEFGEDDDAVDVLTLHPTPQLLVARKMVVGWNASQYTDYKPHATIGPAGSAAEIQYHEENRYSDERSIRDQHDHGLPLSLRFARIGTFWDDKQIFFNLEDYY